MRAVLEVIAPQAHEGDHETTAEVLHTGSQGSVAVEMIRLLIYLEANNMIYRLSEITGCTVDLSLPENMMDFLRRMGFLTRANIDWLGSSANPTSHTFLERLLHCSLFDDKSVDVLGWLVPSYFDINHHWRITPRQIVAEVMYTNVTATLLQACSLAGNIHAVSLLMDLGGDPYKSSDELQCSPLECAASLQRHGRAEAIGNLLLSNQTQNSSVSHTEAVDGAFLEAIRQSNTKLIMRLLLERKRSGHGEICLEHFTIAAKRADCDTIRLLVHHAPRDSDGSVLLPKDILFSAVDLRPSPPETDSVLDTLNYLLDLGADPTILRCRNGHDDGFILNHVMFGTYRFRARLEEDYAMKVVEALRKHGCPPKRPKPESRENREPSTLQAAIYCGYPRLIEYLLDWGFDIDHCKDDFQPGTHTCEDCETSFLTWFYEIRGRSPLLTALENGETEIAKMLFRRKPNLRLHGGEQSLAMKGGDDAELVTMLLQAGSTDVDGLTHFLEQAVSWRNPKSIQLLMSIVTKGHTAVDTATTLRAALIIGDDDKLYQQIAVCDYDSQLLFEAVVQAQRSQDYRKIVERLLDTRRPAPNDGYEIRAVACAATHHDIYLMGVLMQSIGQGPWVAHFPDINKNDDTPLSRWMPDDDQTGTPMHILNYAAKLNRYHDNATVLQVLLVFNIPAQGMRLHIVDNLSAETWNQLIASGADPNHGVHIIDAARENMSAHVKVLCESGVLINTMDMDSGSGIFSARTAVQTAVQFGGLEMFQLLLHHGADVKHPAGYWRGATCLQLAAGAGNIGLVRLLLDRGVKVNEKRSLFCGRTAIEIAAENGRLDVLKLLLLQEEHLFRTAAERFQFVRAVQFAESGCRGSIVKMLKQHINWDDDDQQRFDEIRMKEHVEFHIDEMTQRPLDSEKRDPEFYDRIDDEFPDVYNIDGIEQWIGERPKEQVEDWTSAVIHCNFEGDPSMHRENCFDASHHGNATQETTMPAGECKSQVELQSDAKQLGELLPAHDALVDPVDLRCDRIGQQPARQWHAWKLDSDMRAPTRTSAPQVLRNHYKDPVWLEMEDDDIDNMMQDLSGGLVTQDRAWGALAHRPATQNVDREPGMVLGEVLDEAQHINTTDDDAVYYNSMEDICETDHSHVQIFDWGFWDDDSFALHSGNWGVGS